jgi:hypothetical protein
VDFRAGTLVAESSAKAEVPKAVESSATKNKFFMMVFLDY